MENFPLKYLRPRSAALLLAAVLAAWPAPSRAETPAEAQKKNLEDVSRQLEEKKKELDYWRAEEERIAAELAGLKKAEKQDTARRQELEWQLDNSRARSLDAKQKHESLEKARKALDGDISGGISMYAMHRNFYYPYFGVRDIYRDILLRSAVMGKHALLSTITGESARLNKDLEALKKKSLDLKARQDLLDKQASAHKAVLRTKRDELEHTRGLQARLSVEVENLQSAALGLNRLVKKLQKKAPYREDSSPGELPIERRSLPWPAEGKVVGRFGREEVPELKTWIVREGVRIATEQQTPVRAVLAGKVIYSGPFRTYGNVVIVDHEKGFFTVYGLLSRIDVSKGQALDALATIGLAGEDTQAIGGSRRSGGSAVYFEIRKGDRALDPMQWLAN